MKLKDILNNIDYEVISGDVLVDVKDIAYNSKNVKEGFMFVALTGFMVDGHKYIEDAINNGAKVLMVEHDIDTKYNDVTVIKVKDSRRCLAIISRNFFNCPDLELTTIGITGTKGKSTTAISIMNILNNDNKKCGCIGTLGIFIGDKYYHTVNTSPESYDVYKHMREMLDDGVKYLVMEVSSQSLKLHRWDEIIFDYTIFTNLSLDHVGKDEHDSYEDYRECKSRLFKQARVGIFNVDDKEYEYMIKDTNLKKYTFGKSDKADLQLVSVKNIIESGFIGIDMKVKGVLTDDFKVSIPGVFNAYNMMGVILLCKLLNVNNDTLKRTLLHISVKGRLESVNVSDKFNVLIDYAYQGIAMENVIKTIREGNPKRIVVVFGCGGNRSKQRRYDCGRVASRYADFSIITEDNSRYEDVNDIIKDILSTFEGDNYKVIPNRKEAIRYSILNAKEGDVIMILGKGHEAYQEIKGVITPFDEVAIVKEVAKELK
ncbi:MAG: UDP-N-acetylmuramoyl-L-alanyl-D-glutamate--2,6-diaminopimelate ligase [Bacilli bacterium]|nr:UDP-N-acetylmuramoyl-L-alanyl-D-glutamate--2,6-diaminopimelate ligase [Bacilli bacterium]